MNPSAEFFGNVQKSRFWSFKVRPKTPFVRKVTAHGYADMIGPLDAGTYQLPSCNAQRGQGRSPLYSICAYMAMCVHTYTRMYVYLHIYIHMLI